MTRTWRRWSALSVGYEWVVGSAWTLVAADSVGTSLSADVRSCSTLINICPSSHTTSLLSSSSSRQIDRDFIVRNLYKYCYWSPRHMMLVVFPFKLQPLLRFSAFCIFFYSCDTCCSSVFQLHFTELIMLRSASLTCLHVELCMLLRLSAFNKEITYLLT